MMEMVQSRYIEMALRLNINTPDYTWEMEAGRSKLRVNNLARAGKYLRKIGDMGENRCIENRWPKICLREEIRAIGNGTPFKWGAEVTKAFEKVGNEETWQLLTKKEENIKVWENLEREKKILQDQGLQENWGKIEKSNYCRGHKSWKKEICEKYLLDRKTDSKTKEQWARLT